MLWHKIPFILTFKKFRLAMLLRVYLLEKIKKFLLVVIYFRKKDHWEIKYKVFQFFMQSTSSFLNLK